MEEADPPTLPESSVRSVYAADLTGIVRTLQKCFLVTACKGLLRGKSELSKSSQGHGHPPPFPSSASRERPSVCSRRTRSAAYPSGASLPFGNTSPTRPACPYALTISTCTACSQAHARDGHDILIDSSPPRSFSMEPETLIHISGAIRAGLPPPRLHPPIPKDPADSPPPMSQVDGRTRQIGQASTILPPRGLCDGKCRRWARPGAPRSRTLPCPPCPACAIEHRDGSTPGRTARRVRGLVQRSAALTLSLSRASNKLVRLALPQAGGEARERSRRELASPWPLSAARGRQPSPRSASFEPAPGPACPAGHPALRPQERTRTKAASRRLPRPRAGDPAARSCPAGVQARAGGDLIP